MVIHNSSRYSDAAVSTLVTWVWNRLNPADNLRHPLLVQVTNTRGAYRGRCFGQRRVLLRIGAPERFPNEWQYKKRAPSIRTETWQEALVGLAAHEFNHVREAVTRRRTDEVQCERVAFSVIERYRQEQTELQAVIAEAEIKEKERCADLSAAKAMKNSPANRIAELTEKLNAWTTKRKRADTYIKKYTRAIKRLQNKLSK